MISRLIGPPASALCARRRRVLAVLIVLLCAAPTGLAARAGSRRRDRGAAGGGQGALSQVPRAVPRREGRRRRLRDVAPAPQAAQLHDGQVQGPHDGQRRASDASGPGEHHQARHALHVDARLARSLRPGSVEHRLLHHDLLPRFLQAENVPQPVALPSAPRSTNETIELGKKLYEDTGCVKCHGTLGRGDGPSASTLKDDSGYPIRAANLAQRWTFRGGSSREDIFRTMSTGLNGTPMPSFLDALTPEQRWAITDFIASLSSSDGPGYTNLVVAKHVQEPIDVAKGAASFAAAPVARFPIIGQIMEPDARSIRPRPPSWSRRFTMRSPSPSSCDGTT